MRQAAYEAELARGSGGRAAGGGAQRDQGRARAQPAPRLDDSLEPALFTNNVDRTALDAMHAAVVASFPDFRRYLRAKARLLGHATRGLPWWDLFAPVGDPVERELTGPRRPTPCSTRSATYSPTLAALAERAFDERWIDAEPRDGKRAAPSACRYRRREPRAA